MGGPSGVTTRDSVMVRYLITTFLRFYWYEEEEYQREFVQKKLSTPRGNDEQHSFRRDQQGDR